MPNHPVAEDRPSAPPASHRRPHARGDVDLAFAVDEDAARELARALAALGFRRVRAEVPDGPGLYVIGRFNGDGLAPVYWRAHADVTAVAPVGALVASHAALVEEVDALGRSRARFEPEAITAVVEAARLDPEPLRGVRPHA
jgi:hypothetical protein